MVRPEELIPIPSLSMGVPYPVTITLATFPHGVYAWGVTDDTSQDHCIDITGTISGDTITLTSPDVSYTSPLTLIVLGYIDGE